MFLAQAAREQWAAGEEGQMSASLQQHGPLCRHEEKEEERWRQQQEGGTGEHHWLQVGEPQERERVCVCLYVCAMCECVCAH